MLCGSARCCLSTDRCCPRSIARHACTGGSLIDPQEGELFSPTQYRPDEDACCEHGGYCYPAKDIKLIGSIRTPPDASVAIGDAADAYQGVTTSCELLEDDRAAIVAAGAQDLLRDCR